MRAFLQRIVDRVSAWGAAPDREGVVDAASLGPCPRCGRERVWIRDVRVDDLGYHVRVDERTLCGCEPGARPGSDPEAR